MRNLLISDKPVTVHQDKLRFHRQLIQRAVHGQIRSIMDVDAVDFLRTYTRYGKRQRLRLDHLAQCVTLCGGKLFRVDEDIMAEIARENNGRGEYRTRQTSTARFVASRLYEHILVAGKYQCLVCFRYDRANLTKLKFKCKMGCVEGLFSPETHAFAAQCNYPYRISLDDEGNVNTTLEVDSEGDGSLCGIFGIYRR